MNEVTNLILTNHAVKRFSERSGTSIIQAATKLRTYLTISHPISVEEACKYFSMTKIDKKSSYLLWKDPTINEFMLAIVINNKVVTVLTQNLLGKAPRRAQNTRYVISDDSKVTKQDGWLVKESVHLNLVLNSAFQYDGTRECRLGGTVN